MEIKNFSGNEIVLPRGNGMKFVHGLVAFLGRCNSVQAEAFISRFNKLKLNTGCLRERISSLSSTSEGVPRREKSSAQGLSGNSCFPGRGGVLSRSEVSRALLRAWLWAWHATMKQKGVICGRWRRKAR
jgi:hypothetical protein